MQNSLDIQLPTSKSISNRLLIIRALSREKFNLKELSQAADTHLLRDLLRKTDEHNTNNTLELDCKDAGTVMRFLTAYLSIQKGNFVLTGSERMKQRPIGILVDALRQLGAEIQYLEKEGFPPIAIEGRKLNSKRISIDANISSQFISALLLIAPGLPQGLEICFEGKAASAPYIRMTIQLLNIFGIKTQWQNGCIKVENGHYSGQDYTIEADWSSAAFFYEAVAFAKDKKLLLKGVRKSGLQGDEVLPEIFQQLGVITEYREDGVLIKAGGEIQQNITLDFKDIPDLAIPVIATCAGLGLIGRFTGLESLKIKESDRIAALTAELEKLEVDFREVDDNEWVLINSCRTSSKEGSNKQAIEIETYKDHRIAMGFAPFSLLGYNLRIKEPAVVSKSFPGFWKEFAKLQ